MTWRMAWGRAAGEGRPVDRDGGVRAAGDSEAIPAGPHGARRSRPAAVPSPAPARCCIPRGACPAGSQEPLPMRLTRMGVPAPLRPFATHEPDDSEAVARP